MAIFDIVEPNERNSIMQEVMVMQKIRHPNVVRILEAFMDYHNDLVLVLECCAEGDLAGVLAARNARQDRLTEQEVWRWFLEARPVVINFLITHTKISTLMFRNTYDYSCDRSDL